MVCFVFRVFLPKSATSICSGRMSSVCWDRSELLDASGALPLKALPQETSSTRRLPTQVPSAGIHWLRWHLLSAALTVLSMSLSCMANLLLHGTALRLEVYSGFILKAAGDTTKKANAMCHTQWPNM